MQIKTFILYAINRLTALERDAGLYKARNSSAHFVLRKEFSVNSC